MNQKITPTAALMIVIGLMAPLTPARTTAGETTRVSVASDGMEGNNNSEYPSLSADGRFVAFMSQASNLVPGDTNGAWDIFVHDRGIACDLITRLKANCKDRNGRFKVRGAVVSGLAEGTEVTLCLDLDECELNGNEECCTETINGRGRAKCSWTTLDKGDHCVILADCPDLHRGAACP